MPTPSGAATRNGSCSLPSTELGLRAVKPAQASRLVIPVVVAEIGEPTFCGDVFKLTPFIQERFLDSVSNPDRLWVVRWVSHVQGF